MTLSNLPPLVTVFGGSGFVGRHVVRALAKRGYRIRVAVRRPDLAASCSRSAMSARFPSSRPTCATANRSMRRCRAPITSSTASASCSRAGRNTFDAVQDFGARAVAEAARGVGATLTHISAIGADANSRIALCRSQGPGRKGDPGDRSGCRHPAPVDHLRTRRTVSSTSSPKWRASRRSCRWSAAATRRSSRSTSRMSPKRSPSPSRARSPGARSTNSAAPEVLTFKNCLEIMLKIIDRKRTLLPLPFGIASMIGSVASMVPFITPPLTRRPGDAAEERQCRLRRGAGRGPHAAGLRHRADLGRGDPAILPGALSSAGPIYPVRQRRLSAAIRAFEIGLQ